MNVKEAKDAYRGYLQNLQKQKNVVSQALKQKEESPDDQTVYTNSSGVVLDLSEVGKELDQKMKDAQDYFSKLMEYSSGMEEAESAKQNAEAMGKGMQDMAKCIEIARRLAKGGRVPATDEQKLMEFDKDMYQMAKTQGMMAKEHEKHESLWGDEEEGAPPDVHEMVDGMEAPGGAPDIEMDAITAVE